MKKIGLILLSLLFLTGCGIIKNLEPTKSVVYIDYGYLFSFKETAQIAKNVYIGKIVRVNPLITKGFLDSSDGSLIIDETKNFETCEFQVDVTEVFKGDYIPSKQITDRITAEFKDFLIVGGEYVFCTGFIEKELDERVPAQYYRHSFGAVRINNNGSLAFVMPKEILHTDAPDNLTEIHRILLYDIKYDRAILHCSLDDLRKIDYSSVDMTMGAIKSIAYKDHPTKESLVEKQAVLTFQISASKPYNPTKNTVVLTLPNNIYEITDSCYYFIYKSIAYIITHNDIAQWDFLTNIFNNMPTK